MSAKEPGPYWKLVLPYWDKISIYDGEARFLREFQAAPEPVQHLFAAHWLQSEVRNGGFGQFFGNSTGVLAPEAERGFRAIGMPETAAVIAAHIASFGPDYPRDQDDREDILDLMDERLEALLEADDLDGIRRLTSQLPPADEEIWKLLDTEQGGFGVAANRYAVEANPDVA